MGVQHHKDLKKKKNNWQFQAFFHKFLYENHFEPMFYLFRDCLNKAESVLKDSLVVEKKNERNDASVKNAAYEHDVSHGS